MPARAIAPSLSMLHLTIAAGTTIAWSELGAGPPLILLHGLGDSHRTWHTVAPLFAKRFRVLAPDLPGHGLSARPDAPYTVKWYASVIADWMDAIGVRSAHVCGHSYGGGIAQWMLLEHRQKIDRLALLSAGGLGREVGVALRLGAVRLASPFFASRFIALGTRLLMPRASRSFAMRGAKEIARLARLNGAPNTGLALRRTLSACIGLRGQRVQTWEHIENMQSLPPISLFWGARDWVLPVRHAHETERRLANVLVHVYPHSGHFVHLEEPDAFARDLTCFLEAKNPACARLRSAPRALENGRGRKAGRLWLVPKQLPPPALGVTAAASRSLPTAPRSTELSQPSRANGPA